MRRHTLFTILFILLSALTAVEAAPKRKKSTAKKPARTTAAAKPRTSGPFVVKADAPPAPKGLTGKNIALWQSHGRYFDQKEGEWAWQRSRLLGTVEDLFPQAFVVPYLIPMLENAGAYVMTPRERDVNDVEIIVDADGGLAQKGYRETNGSHKWRTADGVSGFAYTSSSLKGTDNPFRKGTLRMAETVTDEKKAPRAIWSADIPETGEYAVYVSYASLPESATDARYVVTSLRGTEEFTVNQTMGGGTWVYLGTFPFAAGTHPVVELVGVSSQEGKTVTADAVKIGGGMGNVVRGGDVSGYPRWGEGARYWLQWAGVPSSVYSPTSGSNDYEDDYKCRGMWVNWLAGGSKNLPGANGLGIPVDLSFAFHTDAGTTSEPGVSIGTLPIVSTKGEPLGNGRSRSTNKTFAQMVTNQIVGDIRELYDSDWTERKMRDRGYHEAMEPRVPAMLLELLSHQNFADMKLGLDPMFRFDVSRAVYKGMLKYLHETAGTPYVVQPLPVHDFAIAREENGSYLLSWKPTPDPLEPTAKADYYIVYERVADGVFTELAVVDDPYISVTPPDTEIYSYKVVAANDGGISFPSEVLALCDMHNDREQVTIVNGFTRVSGPTPVYRNGEVGFDYADDHGVPYIKDISFTGEQTEFRPSSEWISNDAPGHGSSRATHETEVVAGNTFDFVYIHGSAIRAAGHGFVSASLGAFVAGMPQTRIVDLILGKQKEISVGNDGATRFKPFTEELRTRLTDFCNDGGSLLVTGSYIGTDLFDNSFSSPSVKSADRQFARDVLGIEWRQAKATVTGGVREIRGRFRQFGGASPFEFEQQLNSECYAVESPESFIPTGTVNGSPILRYTENNFVAGTASILPTHRTVVLGFPFETIRTPQARDLLMGQILSFLSEHGDLSMSPSGRVRVYPETMIVPNRMEEEPASPAREPAILAQDSRSERKRRKES